MNRVRPHAVIALAIAAALVVIVAGPASAVSPDGTAVLTVTSDNPAKEDTTATIAGECPAGTTKAVVDWNWTDGSGAQNTQTPFVVDPAVGTFSNFYYLSNQVGRGVVITFSLSCLDAADAVLATASQPYTQPDFGQTLSVPATVAVSADIIATVNCPSAGVNNILIIQNRGGVELTPTQWIPYTGAGAYNLGTPTSVGAIAGDAIDVDVYCIVSGDSSLYVSLRNTRYSAVAAADTPPVVVAPPAVARSGAAVLASTGSELGWMSAVAATMLMMGAVLIFRSRARGARA